MLINLKTFEKHGKVFGEYFENENIFLFFGNKSFEKKHFSFFPSIDFQFLKQIHGNEVVFFDKHTEELRHADGHFTNKKNLALVIQTADCLPILIYDNDFKWILAMHAGWRGVENKITEVGLEKLMKNCRSTNFSFFVGPHIQLKSFEVDLEVAQKLNCCVDNSSTKEINSFYDKEKNKYFFDLKKIVHKQASMAPLQVKELYLSDIDTFTDERYSSFRRLKTPCRNYSFIYLKN